MLKLGEKGTILQRDKETYAIAPHIACGVVTPGILRKIADIAEKYDASALKLTSAARIAIVGIKEEDVDSVWEDLGLTMGHAVGLCVRSVKACPGTAFCRLGLQDSLSMGMKLDELYHGMDLPGKTKMGVSGCTNECAENCIKDVSLVGRKKGWTVKVGGCGTGKPRLADTLQEGLNDDEALNVVARVIEYYKQNAQGKERIGKMIDRMGIDAFRDAVHKS